MGRFRDGDFIPPKVTKKMSLVYLQSFYKFLEKAYAEDSMMLVSDLMIDVKKILDEEGIEDEICM